MKPVRAFDDLQAQIEYLHKIIWLLARDAVVVGLVQGDEQPWDGKANHFAIGEHTFYWAYLAHVRDEDLDLLVDAVREFDNAAAFVVAKAKYGEEPPAWKNIPGFDRMVARCKDIVPQLVKSARLDPDPTGEPGKEISIGIPAPIYTQPELHIEFLGKLIWLAATDVLFFSNHNDDIDDWCDHAQPAIILNDTFAPGISDADSLPLADLDLVCEAVAKFGDDGAMAWASVRRQVEIQQRWITPKYLEAKAFVEAKTTN
jgi:hypothetical protein